MGRRKKINEGLVLAEAHGPIEPGYTNLDEASKEYHDQTLSPPPTIEQRLAALEAALLEKDRVIATQAGVIAIGVDNAERLRKSRAQVDRLEGIADEAKKEASEAKKAYEAAVKEHFELEAELDSPQQRLPFPAEAEATPYEVIERGVEAMFEPPAAEPWRSTPLAKLGIPDELPRSLVDKLAEANLTTVGELSDYLAPGVTGFCKRLTDLAGVGEAKAEAINDALMQFWQTQSLDAAEVNAELVAGVEEIEEYQRGVAAIHANPSGNGEWEDSEPDLDPESREGIDPDDEPMDD